MVFHGRNPARASCSACAQQKVRCDGQRPCARCARRQHECRDQQWRPPVFSKRERVSRACRSCARAKAKCEAERPCTRCVRLNRADSCASRWMKLEQPERCLEVESPLHVMTPVPDFVTTILMTLHRRYTPQFLRSIPGTIWQAYYRSLRIALDAEKVSYVEQEISDPGAEWALSPPSDPPITGGHLPFIDEGPLLVYKVQADGDALTTTALFNDAGKALFGYTGEEFSECSNRLQEELLGMFMPKMFQFWDPRDLEMVLKLTARIWFEGVTALFIPRVRCVCRNGRSIEVQVLWNAQSVMIDGIVRNVTFLHFMPLQ
ncbi:Zn(2)-C6 fungal-type domain-containing protein [Plasmodiophora brassicae]|uniref:Zn(2)-C6 fungal-type domain-containing protein n=1 Tax=Plasmodiophora brassicae TaxID=37360 RepID=A0A0G4J8U5_PLABS|nr:hypothetical protein PBRA_003288 [Plasmodiophora brassicae]SPQ99644.1 unnamed protein product [Plasmodiophora brassicae]